MAFAALPACVKDKGKASSSTVAHATVPTAPAQPTTTDPYAVPATIDAAYMNRVLAGLDALVGDAVRIIVSTKTIPPDAYDRLRAAYGTDPELQLSIDSFQHELRDQLAGYKSPPGNLHTTVTDLLSATKSCMYAKVARDYSATTRNTSPNTTEWIAVKPLDKSRDTSKYNAVGWAYIYEGFERGVLPPRSNPCES